jgi:hypothetical protein
VEPAAILKGWVDRVFRPGVAYRFLEGDQGEGVPVGLLPARAALVFNTSNTALERELRVFGDPLETLWKNCIFDLCGVKTFYRRTFSIIVTGTAAERQGWLVEMAATVNHYFPGKIRAISLTAGRQIAPRSTRPVYSARYRSEPIPGSSRTPPISTSTCSTPTPTI